MYYNVHKHHQSANDNIISIYNLDPSKDEDFCGFYSAGIHPWHADLGNMDYNFEKLEKLAQKKNCLAIGECGIDKINGPDFHIQNTVFEKQAQLAHEVNKPVILHAVKSYAEILQLHQKIKPSEKWIIHGFRKDYQLAKQLNDKGIMISLGKALLHQQNLFELVKNIDLKFIFLESDEEQETSIPILYEKVSAIKNISLNELKKNIQDNFTHTFKVD